MTSKLVIREFESPLPAASLILISQMTSSLVVIPNVKFSSKTSKMLEIEHCLLNSPDHSPQYIYFKSTDLADKHNSRSICKQNTSTELPFDKVGHIFPSVSGGVRSV